MVCPNLENLEADEIGLCEMVDVEQQVYIIGYYNELATPVEVMTSPTGKKRVKEPRTLPQTPSLPNP